MFMTDWVYQT